MPTIAETAPVSKPALWMGRGPSGLVIVFMLFDGAHQAGAVACRHGNDGQDRLWFERNSGAKPRVMTLVCTILYAIPPTSILGAILLTGYLGGAMASHLRIGSPPVQPHPVRVLFSPDGVGRAVVARQELARGDALATLMLLYLLPRPCGED